MQAGGAAEGFAEVAVARGRPGRTGGRRPGQRLALAGALLIVLAVTGCPPKIPCGERIKDPETHQAILLSHPVIQDLGRVATLHRLTLGECFVKGRTVASLYYLLPESYSAYGVAYLDLLRLYYAEEGGVELADGGLGGPRTLDRDAILRYFRARIGEIEGDPRVQEFLAKTEPDPASPLAAIYESATIRRTVGGSPAWVEYSFFTGLVRGYLLPNSVDWQQFPEIAQAHRVVQDHLLVGQLADCAVGRDAAHAYTTAAFHDSPTDPWRLTVALICKEGWKDASVQINADGSFESMGVTSSY